MWSAAARFSANSFAMLPAAARAWPKKARESFIVRDLKGLPASLGRSGPLEIRLATTKKDIRKAQKLRFKIFFEEGQAIADRKASLTRRDICPYDRICDHLLVIDHAAVNRFGRSKPKVVGTYRLLRQDVAELHSGFYSAQEFQIENLLARHAGKRFLELGRSCVHRDYRSKRTLELLWRGIWAYVQHHRMDVMIGCASLSGTNPLAHAQALSFLHHHAPSTSDWNAKAHERHYVDMNMIDATALDARKALAKLPPLVKGYLRVGATFGEGAVVDRMFGTTDVLVVMPIADIQDRYISHFGGDQSESQAA